MSTFLAYVLVVLCAPFCLVAAIFLAGLPVALILVWAPVQLRVMISGVIAGALGVISAVAFGYGIFHCVAGSGSFTAGAFLASTVPLLPTIRGSYIRTRQHNAARKVFIETMKESRDSDEVNTLAAETLPPSLGTTLAGMMLGLALVTAWFLTR